MRIEESAQEGEETIRKKGIRPPGGHDFVVRENEGESSRVTREGHRG